MKRKNYILLSLLTFCIYHLPTLTTPHITVIGTGYVGLVTGAGLAAFENNVICADIDQKKIDGLKNGIIPIYEPGLDLLVQEQVLQNRLAFTTDIPTAIATADAIFIAVGTPMGFDGSANLSYVESVVSMIANNIQSYTVICTKSTVPVGTGDWIESLLLKNGIDKDLFDVVSNPEFLREGSAVNDFLHPDRIVVGTKSPRAQKRMKEIYTLPLARNIPFVFSTIKTAETIKYASNAFLAVKLSFINELANLCDATDANIADIAQAMGLDSRISPKFLQPGPGFGGSCFPKDSLAIIQTGRKHNVDLKVIQASLDTNKEQKTKPAKKMIRLLDNQIAGKTIGILGLTFKAETDDVRYSPAFDTITYLQERGARIKAYDPQGMDNMKELLPNIIYCSSLDAAVRDVDGVIIMTEWNEFKNIDLLTLASMVKDKNLVDARNIINPEIAYDAGFAFDNFGYK